MYSTLHAKHFKLLAVFTVLLGPISLGCKAHRSGNARLESFTPGSEDEIAEKILSLTRSISAQLHQYIDTTKNTSIPSPSQNPSVSTQTTGPATTALQLDSDAKASTEADLQALVNKLYGEVQELKKADKGKGERIEKSETVLDKVQGDISILQQAVAENAAVTQKISDKIAPAQQQLVEIKSLVESVNRARNGRMTHYVRAAANFWALGAPTGSNSLGQLPANSEVRVVETRDSFAIFVTKDGRSGEMKAADLTPIARWEDVKNRRFVLRLGGAYIQFFDSKQAFNVKFLGVEGYVFSTFGQPRIQSIVWSDDDRQFQIDTPPLTKVYRIYSIDEVCWLGNIGMELVRRAEYCYIAP